MESISAGSMASETAEDESITANIARLSSRRRAAHAAAEAINAAGKSHEAAAVFPDAEAAVKTIIEIRAAKSTRAVILPEENNDAADGRMAASIAPVNRFRGAPQK